MSKGAPSATFTSTPSSVRSSSAVKVNGDPGFEVKCSARRDERPSKVPSDNPVRLLPLRLRWFSGKPSKMSAGSEVNWLFSSCSFSRIVRSSNTSLGRVVNELLFR